MIFRKGTAEDAPFVAQIYDQARMFLKLQGVPQWQNGKPDINTYFDDLKNSYAYVVESDGKVIASAAVISDPEPLYKKIYNGNWLGSEPYLTIHRVAVSQDTNVKGAASFIMSQAELICHSLNRSSMRIDTHEKNLRMQSMLIRNGFVPRGTITIEDGTPRIAFEKII